LRDGGNGSLQIIICMRREYNISNSIIGVKYILVISSKSSRHPLAKTWLCQSHTGKCVWNSTNEFVFPTASAYFRCPCVSLPVVASCVHVSSILCQSQWPRGLRHGSALAGIAGSNCSRPRMTVSCECCVFSGRGLSASGWSLFQASPTKHGVSECDHET